jgi:flagellar motor switch protein FliG
MDESGVAHLVEMLLAMDVDAQRRLLEGIRATRPQLALAIRARMFVFEDIATLPAWSVQQIIAEINRRQEDGRDRRAELALALRRTSDALKTALYANMSARSAEILRSDVAALGPQPASKIAEAQNTIVELVRRLQDDGRIQGKQSNELI